MPKSSRLMTSTRASGAIRATRSTASPEAARLERSPPHGKPEPDGARFRTGSDGRGGVDPEGAASEDAIKWSLAANTVSPTSTGTTRRTAASLGGQRGEGPSSANRRRGRSAEMASDSCRLHLLVANLPLLDAAAEGRGSRHARLVAPKSPATGRAFRKPWGCCATALPSTRR